MSFMVAFGACICCGQLFSFNPDRVPSVIVRGEREPVCEDCMRAANKLRISRGERPHEILVGAYEESEVDR